MELTNYYINCEATRSGLVRVEAHTQDEAMERLRNAYASRIVRQECLSPAVFTLRDDTDTYPVSGRIPTLSLWYDIEVTAPEKGMDKANVRPIQVIEMTYERGDGSQYDPVREVTLYTDLTGRILFERDSYYYSIVSAALKARSESMKKHSA